MAEGVKRGHHPTTDEQRAAFIEALRENANVSQAAKRAGFDRTTAYAMRKADEAFADAWDDALAQSLDKLRQVAFEIATGVDKPVISMGKLVMVRDDEGKERPLMERVVDGQTLRFLLAAHDPTYRPQPAVAAPATVPADLLPDPAPTPDEPGPEKPIL
jgi:hypothetical protein